MARKARGFSLLEFVLAVPATLVFLLGAMQAAHMLQAKNALNRGVESALRCLYPVNGQCVAAKAVPASALYDWYQVSGNNKYSVGRYRYRGLGAWFETPRYTYEAQARIPSDVTSFYTQSAYYAKRVSYAVNGELDYWLLTARSPYARGSNINEPISFRYPKTTNSIYPAFAGFDISNVTLSPAKRTKSVAFSIPRPWGATDAVIFKARDLNSAGDAHAPDFAQDLSRHYNHQAYIKIWVTGEGHGKELGKVELSLSWDGGSTNLGGRVFTGPGTWNFVPRGFPANGEDDGTKYYDNALMVDWRGREYTEWTLYNDEMLAVPYDKTIRLNLNFVTSGNASWSGNGIRIYTPLFEHKAGFNQSCSTVSRAEFERDGGETAKRLCRITPPQAARSYAANKITIDTSLNVDPAPAMALGCNLNETAARSSLQSNVPDPGSYDLTPSGELCAPYTVTAPCPGFGETIRGGSPNYGVPEKADPHGHLVDVISAAALCPPAIDQNVAAGTAPYLNAWREKTVTIPDAAAPLTAFRFTWSKRSCDLAPVLPAPVSFVPESKRTISLVNVTSENVFTGEQDPRQLKKEAPHLYDCPDIKLIEKTFADNQAPPLPATSLFTGARRDLGERCYVQLLHEDALANGLNREAFFSATPEPQYVDAVLLEAPPAGDCGVRYQIVPMLNSETKIASALPEGQKPPACSTSPCRAELAGYKSPAAGTAEFDLAKARQAGIEALSAMYPNAKACNLYDSNCNVAGAPGGDCIDICLKTSTAGGQTSFAARALARVPLAFGAFADVHADGHEQAELNFAR